MSVRSKNESMNDAPMSRSVMNSSRYEDNKNKGKTYILKGERNYSVGFDEVFKIYKFKLHKLQKFSTIKKLIEKFWVLLNHNFEGEIEKENFILLFRKIYRVILPYFNHNEIFSFLEGEWVLISKGKNNSINFEIFEKYMFNFIHCWAVHISKEEYISFLEMLYSRIVKYRRTDAAGTIKDFLPSIRVKLFRTKPNSDYEINTWEPVKEDEAEDLENYEYTEPENEEDKRSFKRPALEHGYLQEEFITIYNEEIYFENEEEVFGQLKPMEILEHFLMDDEEIVIFGYPTQYVLMHFKNRIGVLVNMIDSGEFDKEFAFKMSDFKPYEKYSCVLEIIDKESMKLLSDALLNNKSVLLSRDILEIEDLTDLGQDFIEDELNIYNNTRINYNFDRKINPQEIKIGDKKKTSVNIDHVILDPIYKKALENVIKDDKIGLKSNLWTEKLHKKFRSIIETKFSLIYKKLVHLIQNIGFYSSIIELISEDIKNEDNQAVANNEIETQFFRQFESKEKIVKDKFDSDLDIIDEANKKSPVVLVLGAPLMGKTSICKKLAAELNMVFMNPLAFIDEIFAKVAKFEEDLANSGEDNAEPEEGDEADPNKPKKPKKGPESVLTQLEFDIYTELTNGQAISEETLNLMYRTILTSNLAFSRGVIIEHNSAIYPADDNKSFSELLLGGYLGNVKIDYVIDLTMPESEIELRKNSIKFNLKSTNIISRRDIELIIKPKKAVKVVYEDEINEDEEEQAGMEANAEEQPELSDEEKEKIPKESDLLEIQNFDENFKNMLDYYYGIQMPIYKEFIKTLKKNYYIKIDITGFDYDDAADLIKRHLDFSYPERPIAKALEQADYKELLLSNREGILPFRRWSLWKTIDPVALKDDFVILNGSTEFPAEYMCRVFLFINEDNRKKFLENPKKYLNAPPEVPNNYRVAVFGPPKSGKNTVAKIISGLFGWKRISLEEIHEQVKEYQKSLEEPEPNNVYSHKIHFAAHEWKELTTTNKKEKKPENFYSKIIFMLDYLGIPLDKKKSYEVFREDLKYNEDKLNHLLNPPKKKRRRKAIEVPEGEAAIEGSDMNNVANNEENEDYENTAEKEKNEAEKAEEDASNENLNKEDLDLENKYEENYENAEYAEQKLNEEDDENNSEFWEDEPYEDPFPPDDDFVIDDLRTEELYYRFNVDGGYPRPGGFILMSHPINEEEINKFAEFNIVIDKVIYLVDQSEEPLRALMTRKNPNFEKLDEEKQGAELEKTKAEVAKFDEIINLLKEKYTKNNEDPVIEINCADSQEQIRSKLQLILNPFYPRIDNEERSYGNADVPEDKVPISKGEFGNFCPVTYKEDNWLYYCLEEFETQINHKKYRFASEKELETFKKNPLKYINMPETYEAPSLERRLAPIAVPPPHIYIGGHQGSGLSTLLSKLVREFKLKKRELKQEFMAIWDEQRLKRKGVRVQRKREELLKQKEEQEVERKANREANPDAEAGEAEEMNIEELLANDAQLDEEEEGFNAVENDKQIFKSLFDPFAASVYDASWFEINEKITTQFMEFLTDSKKTPNVFVFIRITLKTLLERHLNMKQIKEYHSMQEEKSKNKKLEAIEKLKRERREEKYNELKEQFASNMEEENQNKENEDEENMENAEGNQTNQLPDIESIQIELSEEEIKAIMDEPDPELPELQTIIDAEKERLVKRYEDNNNFLNEFIEQLKAKLIPVIEISNDISFENVYKHLLYQLNPYLKNRENLVEKQLVHYNFPELTIRKTKDLYASQIFRLGAYRDYSPITPEKLVKSCDYPLVYRDKLYFFNTIEERSLFAEEPLKYRTGKEFPLDVTKSCFNYMIYVIGNLQSGKTAVSRILEEKGFLRITLRKAISALLDENVLRNSVLRSDLMNTLTSGNSIDDQLAIRILRKRLELSDCINKNIVIDGFPFTLSQTRSIIENPEDILMPTYVFVCQAPENVLLDRAMKQKAFKSLIPVITERLKNTKDNLTDIIKLLQNKQVDIRYLDTRKSFWYLKDQIIGLLETRRRNSLKFAAAYNYNKPCNLNGIASKGLMKHIIEKNKHMIIKYYSPVAMKINNEFNYNKYINYQNNNYITYYKGLYSFLKNEEEFNFFSKNPELYYKYIEEIKLDVVPIRFLKPFDIAKRIAENRIFEYQSCCPVSYIEDKLLKDGKIIYALEYKGKLFECETAEKLIKFSYKPENYNKIKIKVKTIDDNLIHIESQVNFENTVNYLETNFGSFITKGMLELSKNRIKYPFLSVKETSIKYLALFLKANNPNNNEYAKKKYSRKLQEFLNNAKLPYELLEVYEQHKAIPDENKLQKELKRNQLNKLAEKYDDLMEKAKIQKNTRFDNFFKN